MLSQIIAVTGLNLRSIRERLGSSAVAIFGIVGVVVVFVGVLSVAEGFHAAMQAVVIPSEGDEDAPLFALARHELRLRCRAGILKPILHGPANFVCRPGIPAWTCRKSRR